MADLLRYLLQTPLTLLADVGAGERVLVRSDRSGTMQVFEVEAGGGLRQLTALPGPVGRAAWLGDSGRVVLEVDQGGDERYQLLVLDPACAPEGGVTEREALEALTDEPSYGHHLAGVSPDGARLAFTSNRRNGVDFDLWVRELATGDERTLYSGGGWCMPASGWSPDGRWVAVQRPGPLPLDTDLLLVEAATGAVTVALPHGGEAAQVGPPAWVGPGRCWVAASVGLDLAAPVPLDPRTGQAAGEPVELGAEVDELLAAPDGSVLAVVVNVDASHRISLLDATDGHPLDDVTLPEPGALSSWAWPGPRWSPDGRRLYFTSSTPRQAGDVWCYDRDSGETRQVTTTPAPVPAEALITPELAVVPSFDGERVPVAVYRPAGSGSGPLPVVVVVHGGPESQAMRSWNPLVQALAVAGYAVVVPNVRGSTGYGKRWASLDDTVKRLDSVADLAAIHDWLPSAGLDPDRAALWGGSYGGYMVLAGLAFQPERWAAGVDIVGISDLVTFLERTSDYRRAHREREYGSLAHDREFLVSASPMTKVADIRAPLFVIHGRNDPRVPVAEAEQLVAALGESGVPCELLIYEDEGHGLGRLANRLDAYPRALAWLDGHLRPGEAGAAAR